MSINRDSIIARIKKLLALAADSTNENECIAAALKAQKLIAEYHVEEFELSELPQDAIEEISSTPYAGKRWRGILASIIAKNFRCKHYIEYSDKHQFNEFGYIPKGKMWNHVFVGYSTDANAALLVYNKMVEVGERRATEVAREAKSIYGTAQGVKTTFLLGFCVGIKQELEKQSQALLIVTPKEVDDYFAITCKPTFDNDIDAGGVELNPESIDYSEQGKREGIDAIRAGRLDGKTSTAKYALASS